MPTHEEEVNFIMGEVADKAISPLPRSRDIRPPLLERLAAMEATAAVPVPEAGRLAGIRRVVHRLLAPTWARQSHFNQQTVAAQRELETITSVLEERLRQLFVNLDHRLGEAEHMIGSLRDEIRGQDGETAMMLSTHDLRMLELEDSVQKMLVRIQSAESAATSLDRRLETVRAGVASLRARRVAALRETVDSHAVEAASSASVDDEQLDEFYVALEERFRGSRDEVMALQRPYLDDLASLAGQTVPLVDIGSGRCEWLELLRERGIPAYGIDTNAFMAEIGRSRGLDVRTGDAVAHLEALPEGSVSAVTAFHLVEHLETPAVMRLLDAALAALRPGGWLLLETPNPTNLIVGAAAFYLDPTHLRPVHPQLLGFIVEERGFTKVETRYLHPSREGALQSELDGDLADDIRWALFGPQDYAVIARKPPLPAE